MRSRRVLRSPDSIGESGRTPIENAQAIFRYRPQTTGPLIGGKGRQDHGGDDCAFDSVFASVGLIDRHGPCDH